MARDSMFSMEQQRQYPVYNGTEPVVDKTNAITVDMLNFATQAGLGIHDEYIKKEFEEEISEAPVDTETDYSKFYELQGQLAQAEKAELDAVSDADRKVLEAHKMELQHALRAESQGLIRSKIAGDSYLGNITRKYSARWSHLQPYFSSAYKAASGRSGGSYDELEKLSDPAYAMLKQEEEAQKAFMTYTGGIPAHLAPYAYQEWQRVMMRDANMKLQFAGMDMGELENQGRAMVNNMLFDTVGLQVKAATEANGGPIPGTTMWEMVEPTLMEWKRNAEAAVRQKAAQFNVTDDNPRWKQVSGGISAHIESVTNQIKESMLAESQATEAYVKDLRNVLEGLDPLGIANLNAGGGMSLGQLASLYRQADSPTSTAQLAAVNNMMEKNGDFAGDAIAKLLADPKFQRRYTAGIVGVLDKAYPELTKDGRTQLDKMREMTRPYPLALKNVLNLNAMDGIYTASTAPGDKALPVPEAETGTLTAWRAFRQDNEGQTMLKALDVFTNSDKRRALFFNQGQAQDEMVHDVYNVMAPVFSTFERTLAEFKDDEAKIVRTSDGKYMVVYNSRYAGTRAVSDSMLTNLRSGIDDFNKYIDITSRWGFLRERTADVYTKKLNELAGGKIETVKWTLGELNAGVDRPSFLQTLWGDVKAVGSFVAEAAEKKGIRQQAVRDRFIPDVTFNPASSNDSIVEYTYQDGKLVPVGP